MARAQSEGGLARFVIFGWLKTVANFRKSRYRGIDRTQLAAHLNGAAYNLLRIAKLTATSA